MLSHIVERIRQSGALEGVLQKVRDAGEPVRVSGLVGSSASILVSILYRELGATTAVICLDEADSLREDLESLLGSEEVFYLPDWEILPYDEFSPHDAIVGTRLRTLSTLLAGRRGVVVIPLRAYLRRIIPPGDLASSIVGVELKQTARPQDLISQFVRMGYTRTQVV